jgi:hypothetical protein
MGIDIQKHLEKRLREIDTELITTSEALKICTYRTEMNLKIEAEILLAKRAEVVMGLKLLGHNVEPIIDLKYVTDKRGNSLLQQGA